VNSERRTGLEDKVDDQKGRSLCSRLRWSWCTEEEDALAGGMGRGSSELADGVEATDEDEEVRDIIEDASLFVDAESNSSLRK
jgi:hypothetical protein